MIDVPVCDSKLDIAHKKLKSDYKELRIKFESLLKKKKS